MPRKKNEAPMSKSKGNAALAEKPADAEDAPAPAEEGEGGDLPFPARPATPAASPDAELVVLDDEFEFEAETAAAEEPAEGARPVAKAKAEEGGGDSMLARYFR